MGRFWFLVGGFWFSVVCFGSWAGFRWVGFCFWVGFRWVVCVLGGWVFGG